MATQSGLIHRAKIEQKGKRGGDAGSVTSSPVHPQGCQMNGDVQACPQTCPFHCHTVPVVSSTLNVSACYHHERETGVQDFHRPLQERTSRDLRPETSHWPRFLMAPGLRTKPLTRGSLRLLVHTIALGTGKIEERFAWAPLQWVEESI